MGQPTRVCVVAVALLASACFSPPPDLSNARCTPEMLSVALPGPHIVDCSVDIDGDIGSFEATAYSNPRTWKDTYEYEVRRGTLHFQLSDDMPPPIGTLTIEVQAWHPDEEQAGTESRIETTIEVVP